MAVHKVPLDVEADDKFLGPLSFKQFLFGGGTVIFGYLTFLMFAKGVWPIGFVLFFPTLASGVLAFPWSKQQPSELFLASRIRYYVKPRRRIWDQTGLKHLVTVTAPKREIHAMTDGLDQYQVRSRFNALATMVDSRGWAVKNLTSPAAEEPSDRLVAPTQPELSPLEQTLQSTTDVMDEDNSTIARQFDSMIEQSTSKHKSATQDLLDKARHPEPEHKQTSVKDNNPDFWFMNTPEVPADPSLAVFQNNPVVNPDNVSTQSQSLTTEQPDLNEQELLRRASETKRKSELQTGLRHGTVVNPSDGSVRHEKPLEPAKLQYAQPDPVVAPVVGNNNSPVQNASDPQTSAPAQTQDDPVATQAQQPDAAAQSVQNQTTNPVNNTYNPPVAKKPDPVIIELAQSNDLSVETLARQANKNDDGEVVISLR